MSKVLSLVAAPGGLADESVAAIGAALAEVGARLAKRKVRAPGTAVDLPFDGLDLAAAEGIARRALRGAAVDLLAQTVAERRRALLVADLESTIIENEMLDEMAARIGAGRAVAAITARAMRGELDFAQALERRLLLFAGQPASLIDQVAEAIRLGPGAEVLLAGARRAGLTTALVTGGFHVFADAVAERLGFDRVVANRLVVRDGTIAGEVAPPVIDRDGKRDALLALCAELGIAPERAAAIGDGANDLALLAAAGLGVAYRAKPAVRRAARARIDHADLSALLAFMGTEGG